MPISIRSPGPNVFAASYHFPNDDEVSGDENWPWLQARPSCLEHLCNACSQLNFSWLFSHSLYEFTVSDGSNTSGLLHGICLGSFSDMSRRSACSICQLLVFALENGADIDMLNEFDEWPERDVYIMNYFFSKSGLALSPEAKTGAYAVRLGVWLKSIDQNDSIMNYGRRTVMLQNVSHEPTLYAGRDVALDTKGLVTAVQRWIQPCLMNRAPTMLTPRGEGSALIRLIDTHKSCIIGPLRNEQYVALSYTWGKIDPLVLLKENESQLREDGAFEIHRSRLPVTIQDAIVLCRLLGERYLWVDSLCIMQDTFDKHDQIQQMDRIYQESCLTIVAAAGKDANAGLPGVSRPRDIRQRVVEVDGIRIANLVPSLDSSIASSFWESRGWTFQESLLSLRKLIFTPDQTYYHCQHGEGSEDVHDPLHESLELAVGDIPLRLNIDSESNWRIYRTVVAEYCKRYLSFESDILNAFAGIAAFMSSSIFSGSPLVMGIPVCSLEAGLLWHPAERLRRRPGVEFPSWSWAGWVGMIEYQEMVEYDNIFERTISHLHWGFGDQEADTQGITCIPPDSWSGWQKWTRVVTGEMDESYYIHEDLPDSRWFAHPIDERQWNILSRTPQLNITAYIAQLKLTGAHADLWYQSEVCAEENHEVCHLQVFDQNDRKAGIVIMDGATFEATAFSSRTRFSFIKISQTTLAPGRDDPAWDADSKTFAGQPGEPAINPRPLFDPGEEEFDQEVYDPNICWCLYNVIVVKFEGDVAERIAVGQVHIHAFDGATPEQRTILLG